jgi:hypothetical protein
MSLPWQLGNIDDIVNSSGYEADSANAYEAGILAGVELAVNWLQERADQDNITFRGQISRIWQDVSYQLKWLYDQINEV